MFKRLFTTRNLVLSAILAALYAALTLLLAPISYGEIQCRVSEAMTMLPVLATLIAAILTYRTRNVLTPKAKLPLLSALWPILLNALIVGAVLSLTLNLPFFAIALSVGIGEAVAVALGVLLVKALERVNLSGWKL